MIVYLSGCALFDKVFTKLIFRLRYKFQVIDLTLSRKSKQTLGCSQNTSLVEIVITETMGKHKKFLKAEKAKVKLKATKLKGPQNVTKTDFKVRKIVITEQLKNVQVKEAGTRKIHSINDCLARLKNSSSAEVISNLKEIILYQHDDFQKHLESIIKIVSNLSLSIEKVDRKECFKILDIICAQTTEHNLRPFFPILVTFLKCAMTHIKPAIQEDSLL